MNTTKQVLNWQKTAFRPGQSGNPGGRPKTAAFAEEVREFLKEKIGKDEKPRVREILERLAKTKPEVLLHYAHGKPVETTATVDATGDLDELLDRLAALKLQRERQAQTGDGQQHEGLL